MIGTFVKIERSNDGIGKVLSFSEEDQMVKVAYFDSPVDNEVGVVEVPLGGCELIKLARQCRVYFVDEEGNWKVGRVEGHIVDDKEVFIMLPNNEHDRLKERDVYVRWSHPISDPWLLLTYQISESKFFHESRFPLSNHFISQRSSSGGMTGLISSSIDLENHQIEVVNRVLSDSIQRYLLADEVGLGKTIEAGVIVRQHVLDNPTNHNVLIVVPQSLKEQWIAEMHYRCHLGESYEHRLKIISYEELDDSESRKPSLVVVDEVHLLAKGAKENATPEQKKQYSILRQLSDPDHCPKLLLLSATPALNNEEAFLGILHLLDPFVYDLNDLAAFKNKIKNRKELADSFVAFDETADEFFLEDIGQDLKDLFPGDEHLSAMMDDFLNILNQNNEDEEIKCSKIRDIRTYISETYKLHRRILRNRREDVKGLTPGRCGLLPLPDAQFRDLELSRSLNRIEEELENWRDCALASLHGVDETSDRWDKLGKIYFYLLEALWSDPFAFEYLLKLRLEGIGESSQNDFGSLCSQNRINEITKEPLFEGEGENIKQLLDLKEEIAALRNEMMQLLFEASKMIYNQGRSIVCFTSGAKFADELYNFFKVDEGIGSFVLRQGSVGAIEGWNSNSPRILICDEIAEEGVNLQKNDALMLFADHPMSPNRIEQRIGRIDRYGIGKKIKSVVIERSDSLLRNSWLKCLNEGWKAFDSSISSLQYLVENEMDKLPKGMLQSGVSAIDELNGKLKGDEAEKIEGLRKKAIREIRNQDVLDSIHIAGETEKNWEDRIDKIESNEDKFGDALERWIVNQMQFKRVGIPNPESVIARYNYVDTERGHQTLISNDAFMDYFLGAIDIGEVHPKFPGYLTYPLTIKRQKARNEGLGVARLGNSVVDAFRTHLDRDDRGVSFAIWRQVGPRQPGIEIFSDSAVNCFFRFDITIELDIKHICKEFGFDSRIGLHPAWVDRKSDEAFSPKCYSFWLSSDGLVPSQEIIKILNYEYQRYYTDTNIKGDQWKAVLDRINVGDWLNYCEPLKGQAEDLLREKGGIDEKIGKSLKIQEQLRNFKEQQVLSRIRASNDNVKERERLSEELKEQSLFMDALLKGIKDPKLSIQSCGVAFLSSEIFPGTEVAQ